MPLWVCTLGTGGGFYEPVIKPLVYHYYVFVVHFYLSMSHAIGACVEMYESHMQTGIFSILFSSCPTFPVHRHATYLAQIVGGRVKHNS